MSEPKVTVTRGRRRSEKVATGSSFYLEVLILLLAMLLMVLVLTTFMAHTRQISLDAQNTTAATDMAANVADTFSAASSNDEFVQLLSEQMDQVSVQDDEVTAISGDAQVSVKLSQEATDAGTLYNAAITVSYVRSVRETATASRYSSGRGVVA